jgi:hypothetical protein
MKNKTGGGIGTNQYKVKGVSVAKAGERGSIKGGRTLNNKIKANVSFVFPNRPYAKTNREVLNDNNNISNGIFPLSTVKKISLNENVNPLTSQIAYKMIGKDGYSENELRQIKKRNEKINKAFDRFAKILFPSISTKGVI